MNKVNRRWLAFLIPLILAGSVSAHVNLKFPVSGETFVAGDTIIIEWAIVVPHQQENWDLSYSADGGVTWEEIQLDLPPSQINFEWIVPQRTTEEAQISIYMDNVGADYLDISNNFIIQEIPISVRHQGNFPTKFALYRNYPNPFNPLTTIEYDLPRVSEVSPVIYNLRGEEIVRLIDSVQNAGIHKATWDAAHMASGVYLYRIQAGDLIETRKMLLLK